jgi:N6-adenosine-specific RNA methylase IME4
MTAPAPFTGLDMFGYDIIHADPPWAFENYSERGEGRNPNQHYDTMDWRQIADLPVGHLASANCALFLWAVDPLLDKAFEVMSAWGFRFVTVAFTWAKRSSRDTSWFMGTGYYTRANPETCLLGITGNLPRRDAGVRQLVVDPVREHSRKPDRIADDIVRLFGDRPRVELFARTQRPGWAAWGNQTEKFTDTGAGSAAIGRQGNPFPCEPPEGASERASMVASPDQFTLMEGI